ncbi:hypothetical protein HDU98_011785 [Podochytrium sp. JEL0797]|nr:hypothetical protein HDU98_011785 [Podochytrium sp. JEL0797]
MGTPSSSRHPFDDDAWDAGPNPTVPSAPGIEVTTSAAGSYSFAAPVRIMKRFGSAPPLVAAEATTPGASSQAPARPAPASSTTSKEALEAAAQSKLDKYNEAKRRIFNTAQSDSDSDHDTPQPAQGYVASDIPILDNPALARMADPAYSRADVTRTQSATADPDYHRGPPAAPRFASEPTAWVVGPGGVPVPNPLVVPPQPISPAVLNNPNRDAFAVMQQQHQQRLMHQQLQFPTATYPPVVATQMYPTNNMMQQPQIVSPTANYSYQQYQQQPQSVTPPYPQSKRYQSNRSGSGTSSVNSDYQQQQQQQQQPQPQAYVQYPPYQQQNPYYAQPQSYGYAHPQPYQQQQPYQHQFRPPQYQQQQQQQRESPTVEDLSSTTAFPPLSASSAAKAGPTKIQARPKPSSSREGVKGSAGSASAKSVDEGSAK